MNGVGPNPANRKAIEIVAIDQWSMTFRSPALWPLREVLVLNLNLPDGTSATVDVCIQAARVFADDVNEYTGRVQHAPPAAAGVFNAPTAGVEAETARPVTVAELRRGRRANRFFQVVSKDLQRFKALCSDISHSGMRLVAQETLEVGRELELDLDFDDFRFPKVRFRCEVVWCRPRDDKSWWVGLRFLDVEEEERRLIETYIGLVDRSKTQMRIDS
ncbi:MAG TPA: PilZ domain-containing protein [Candidatus Xenobia bacterium]